MKNSIHMLRVGLMTVTGYAALATGTVAAQEGGVAAGDGTTAPGEIVVTAQRREESIQSVPASVTAFGQDAIKSLAISNVDDVTRLTPGVAISRQNGEGSSMSIAIRGISSLVGTAPTAIYIDDTPVQVRFIGAGNAASSAFPSVFDLERIEVLKGPQGTLFGASSEGGAVRFITRPPSLAAWSGHARAEASVVESGGIGYQFGAAVGGPIVEDKLGIRLSAYAQRDGGWIDRQPYGGGAGETNINDAETQAISAALLWRPVENFSITPTLFWQKQTSGGRPFFWRDLSDPDRKRFVSGQLFSDSSKGEFILPALKMQLDVGDVSIISNSSYLDNDTSMVRDYTFLVQEILTGDYTGQNAPGPSYLSNSQKQFVQELRVQGSSLDGRLNWVVGGFYQKVRQKAYQRNVSPDLADLVESMYGIPIEVALGSPVLPGDVVYYGFDEGRDTQIAAFAQADFQVTPRLTMTVGIRQAHSKFDFTNLRDGPFNGGYSSAAGKSSQNDTLPKFGLLYEATNGLRFYASAAKGFRPGGANAPVTALCGPDLDRIGRTNAPTTYGSDSVWAYEVGAKGESFGRRLVWDASGYVIRWKNIQNQVSLPSCGFSYIDNLGSAESRGFDVQLRARPVDGLSVQLAVGYTDAKYVRTIPAVVGNLVTEGQRLEASPWQISFAVDYEVPTDLNGMRPYFHADNQYSATFERDNPANALYNPVQRFNRGANLLAARVGLRNDNMDLSFFVKNLLDTHPTNYTKWTLGSSLYVDTTVAPRTFGMTLTGNF